MEELKYKLTDECITVYGRELHRIEALKCFGNITKGQKGGFVESEENLSQEGDCWIGYNAKVYDSAKIFNNAEICGHAEICGNAIVSGKAQVYDKAIIFGSAQIYGEPKIFDNAHIYGRAVIFGNAEVFGNASVYNSAVIRGYAKVSNINDYIVFKNWWSSGRSFTWTKSNNMWSVGCFYGTGKELIKKAYEDSELSGREYKRVVDYVESILRDTTDEKKSTSL